MKAIDSIRMALEYIESHLTEDIKINQIAEKCFLSRFYFQRLFHDVAGYSVNKYIQFRRLEKATELLRDNKLVNEVAIESGFKSTEHFSRLFKQVYNITPSMYIKNQPPLYHVYEPDVILKNAKLNIGDNYVSNNMVLKIEVCEHEEIEMIGIDNVYSTGIESPGIDQPGVAWNEFHQIKHTIINQSQPYVEYGISHNMDGNGFNYLVARQVDSITDIPKGMTSFVIPAGKYVCCEYQNNSFDDAVGKNLKSAMDYLYNWIIVERNYSIGMNCAIECYTEESFTEPFKLALWFKIKE